MAKRGADFIVTMLWIGFFQFLFTLCAVMIPLTFYWMSDFDDEFAERSTGVATGTVIKKHEKSVVSGRSSTGTIRYENEVRFETREGVEVTFIDPSFHGLPVAVGQTVPIRYVPENPQWAMIARPKQQKPDRTMFHVVMGIFWLISLPVAFLLNRAQLRHFRNRHGDEGTPSTTPSS